MNIKNQFTGLNKVIRTTTILISFCCGLVFSSYAEDQTPDLGIDIDLMNFMEETNDSLTSNISLMNRDGALEDVVLLNELFVMLEEHFAEIGDYPEGARLAKKSTTLTAQLNDAITTDNYNNATKLGIELSNACKSCHEKFK
ncbi:hypothetical protein [Algibacillus agarilyticus]|uniref:hypothetical protein n=1 Tax=Algibacillus agarilyticus TaxID=2234133 RepID=UPI000DD02C3C|nr:hypothetical protein [Algibacillus agarilyticus]